MEMTESSKVYLNNFEVMEQTRKETLAYLESICGSVMNNINGYVENWKQFKIEINRNKSSNSDFNYAILKSPDITLGEEMNVSNSNYLYRILYNDISSNDSNRTNGLYSPLNCIVWATAPISNKKITAQIKKIAEEKGLEDPYSEKQFNLLDQSYDDTITIISDYIISKLDDMIKILETLIESYEN